MRIPTILRTLASLLAGGLGGVLSGEQASPMPYPSADDEAAWPGAGPIRYFQWFPEARQRFWDRREQDRNAVVFVGDSLTDSWKSLASAFPHLKVANRGIGGDTSRGLLFRFSEDVVALKPRAIVLCIGTNDLSAHARPDDIEANIVRLLDLARADQPDVPIVLCTIPPRNHPGAPTQPGAHADLNARIARLAAERPNIALLDLFQGMATPDGGPVPEYFGRDRLHLVGAGYDRWAELIRPAFVKLGIQ